MQNTSYSNKPSTAQNRNLEDTEGMTREELRELRNRLLNEADTIREMISYRKTNYGSNIDKRWLLSAEKALRLKIRAVNELNDEMGRLRREEERARQQTVEAQFISLARQSLPADVFNQILQKALQSSDSSHWEVTV